MARDIQDPAFYEDMAKDVNSALRGVAAHLRRKDATLTNARSYINELVSERDRLKIDRDQAAAARDGYRQRCERQYETVRTLQAEQSRLLERSDRQAARIVALQQQVVTLTTQRESERGPIAALRRILTGA